MPKKVKKVEVEDVVETNIETIDETEETPKEEKKSYRVKKTLDPNTVVTVKNGFNGTLVYKSKKTGETFKWEEFDDEQDMDLAELKNARNSYKQFFENNWFIFDDPEIIDYLNVGNFYKNALNSKGFEELFKMTPEKITAKVAKLSEGQKRSVAFRAKQLIAEGEIDSIKVIDALEKSLSVQLIER